MSDKLPPGVRKLPADIQRQLDAQAADAHQDIDDGVMSFAWQRDSGSRTWHAVVITPRCYHTRDAGCGYLDRVVEWPAACRCDVLSERTRRWAPDCEAHGEHSDWRHASAIVRRNRERQ